MAFVEDFSVFFDTDEFANEGIYDGLTTVNGILSIEYADVFQGDQVGVSSSRPVFTYSAADLTPVTGKSFVVDSVEYTIRDIETDKDMSKLILEATGVTLPPSVIVGVFSVDYSEDFA